MTPEPGGRLARLLRERAFCVTAEVVPPRSADPLAVTAQADVLRGAADAVNVTDNPASSVHMSAVAGAGLVAAAGLEPVLQITCRDRNRMALASDLLGAWALGARNLLCLTGDPPAIGSEPEAMPVFDLTVVELIRLAAGLREEGRLPSGEPIEASPRYLIGVADAPLAPRYDAGRLEEKAEAGADFVQTQIVFDVDAFGSWAEHLRERGLLERLSVLAGVAVARSGASARFMRDRLPGVTVPDAIVDRLERAGAAAADEGVRIAAEVVRGIRGIEGIAGVHLMGLGHPETIPAVAEASGLLPRPA